MHGKPRGMRPFGDAGIDGITLLQEVPDRNYVKGFNLYVRSEVLKEVKMLMSSSRF
jgi:hypothetical protein